MFLQTVKTNVTFHSSGECHLWNRIYIIISTLLDLKLETVTWEMWNLSKCFTARVKTTWIYCVISTSVWSYSPSCCESVCILCRTGAERPDPGLPCSEQRSGYSDSQKHLHSPQLQGRERWTEEVQRGSGPDVCYQDTIGNIQHTLWLFTEGKMAVVYICLSWKQENMLSCNLLDGHLYGDLFNYYRCQMGKEKNKYNFGKYKNHENTHSVRTVHMSRYNENL